MDGIEEAASDACERCYKARNLGPDAGFLSILGSYFTGAWNGMKARTGVMETQGFYELPRPLSGDFCTGDCRDGFPQIARFLRGDV